MSAQDWSPPQLALSLLLSSLSSGVILIVILANRPQLYVYSALLGASFGVLTWLTPAGNVIVETASGWSGWAAQSLLGLFYALGFAALLELTFHAES